MKNYEKAVGIVADQIRNINVEELMKQNKIHLGKDDLPDYLLVQGTMKVLVERFNSAHGVEFLRETLEEEINVINNVTR